MPDNYKKNIVIITGATGSGKSNFALKLAKKINGVIINADSMQIYKQIPILTAQPSKLDKSQIQHYLYSFVDIFDIQSTYSVGKYLFDLKNILQKIDKDKIPIIVGGTMLYITSILEGLNEIPEINEEIRKEIREKYKKKTTKEIFEDLLKIDEKYSKIVDKNNPQRMLRGIEVKLSTKKSIVDFWSNKKQKPLLENYNVKKILISPTREEIYSKINNRFNEMLKNGLIEEMKKIYKDCNDKNINKKCMPKAIGLQEFFDYFDGKITLDAMTEKTKQLSRNYAKRQLTWFKKKFENFEKIDCNSNINNFNFNIS